MSIEDSLIVSNQEKTNKYDQSIRNATTDEGKEKYAKKKEKWKTKAAERRMNEKLKLKKLIEKAETQASVITSLE